MLEKLKHLDRQIREKCLQMSTERDGARMLVFAGELELLFEAKDLIVQNRNLVYRQNLIVPSPTVNL
jgi:hypothetical protein